MAGSYALTVTQTGEWDRETTILVRKEAFSEEVMVNQGRQ